eukprot:1287394-Pyramimonas_sp.AAC.1
MAMMYERVMLEKHVTWRYLMPDSSPQGGWNFLVVRCDEFAFPANATATEILNTRLETVHKQKTLPVMVLGRGAASEVHKTCKIIHAGRCNSGKLFDKWRGEIIGVCSDQGTEALLCDAPNLGLSTLLPEFKHSLEQIASGDRCPNNAPNFYIFPRAVGVHDCCHAFYNALEETVTKTNVWQQLETHVRNILAFLGDKGLRQLFQAKCLQTVQEKNQFKHWWRKLVDWKWEFLQDHLAPSSAARAGRGLRALSL